MHPDRERDPTAQDIRAHPHPAVALRLLPMRCYERMETCLVRHGTVI